MVDSGPYYNDSHRKILVKSEYQLIGYWQLVTAKDIQTKDVHNHSLGHDYRTVQAKIER